MTLTIIDQLISSDRAARSAPGRPHGWEVSWLSGQLLDCHTAITAMMLADTASDASRDEEHRLWPAIHNWAAGLGLTGPDAVAQASEPPGQIIRKRPKDRPTWKLPNNE
ncbi:MAG: hypothetical protein ACRDPY_22870 [Streptosporangiaceae bacterium]